eukprot:254732-Rhodomonas_salina.2
MCLNTNTTPSRCTVHVASKLPTKYSRQTKGDPSNSIPVPGYTVYYPGTRVPPVVRMIGPDPLALLNQSTRGHNNSHAGSRNSYTCIGRHRLGHIL